MQAKERDSNFELLRIYSMVLITANHIVNLGVLAKPPGQETLPWLSGGTFNKMLALILTSCGRVGVALFFMISGYFLIKRDTISTRSFWSLLGKVHFYGLTMFLVFCAVHAATGYSDRAHLKQAVRQSIFLPATLWWFASSYMVLLVISPWLNAVVQQMKRKWLLLPILLFVWYFFYQNGTSLPYYNIVRALFFYMIGAVIRLGADRIPRAGALYAVLSLCAWAACTVVSDIGMKVSYKLMADPGKIFIWTRTQFTNGFLIPARAIFLFLFFWCLKIKWRPINWLAGCTFGIYLSHTYLYLRNFLIFDLLKTDRVFLKDTFPVWLVVDVIAIFCAGVVFEQLFKVCAGLLGRVLQNKE